MNTSSIIATVVSAVTALLAWLFRKNKRLSNWLGLASVVSGIVAALPALSALLGMGKKNFYQTLLLHGFKETLVSATEITMLRQFPSVVKDASDIKILDLIDKLNKMSSPRITSISQTLNASGVVDYIIVLPIAEKTSKAFID